MKRNTHKYELKLKNQTVVYIGTTTDLERRFKEHKRDKEFDVMVVIGYRCTAESAYAWEAERLETYRRNHRGQNPKYNVKRNGR